MNNNSIPLPERFWSRVKVGNRNQCWPWLGGLNVDGYGSVQALGKPDKSHRVAWFLRHGAWPTYICHKCNNRKCCNPDHMYEGNPATNGRDRAEKYRAMRGEKQHMAAMTDEEAARIRAEYREGGISIPRLAEKYGKSGDSIRRLCAGITYTHLSDASLSQ